MRSVQRTPGVVSSLQQRTFNIERLEDRRTLDGVAPYVVEIAPQAAGSVLVRFSEDIVNLDTSDFQLTLRGEAIDLALATLQSQSLAEYTLQLPALADGLFDLTLVSLGSEIADLDGDLLVQDASAQVLIANQPPAWQIDFRQAEFTYPVRRIAALGDSMTAEADGSYVSAVRDLLPVSTAEVDVFANATWKVGHLSLAWETQVRDASYDTIVVFAGVPDLISGTTAESIFQSLKAVYDDALARGVKVICIGVSPWAQYKTWTLERYTQSLQLNELISQYVTNHLTMTRYVNAYSLLGISDPIVRLAPAYDSGDGWHLSSVGKERLGQAVSTAILSLDTPTRIQQSVVLTFSRPVVGLSEAHIRLTNFGSPEPAQLVALDSTSYRIDFSVPAKQGSLMSFNLDLTQGPITDQFNQALPEQVAVSFSCDYRAPQVNVWSPQPWVSALPMEHIRMTFSEIVSPLVSDNLVLRRDGVDIDPLDVTISRLDDYNFDVAFLTSQTSTNGTYQLLFQPGSQPRDSAGNLMRQGALVRWVKLAVEPQVNSGVLQLAGTDGPDNLVVSVTQNYIDYGINGVSLTIPRVGIQRIELEPGAAQDLVSLQATDNAGPVIVQASASDNLDRANIFGNTLSAEPQISRMFVSQDIQLVATGFAQVTAIARAGSASATLFDSSGADKLDSRDQRTTLKGPGYEIATQGFSSISAYSTRGGVDTADLYDSPGNDTVNATMAAVTLQGVGFDRTARNFSRVNVRASQGNDSAVLVGSTAAEKFVGQPSNSAWSSGSLSRYFYDFDTVEVGGQGGLDQATLYDSPGADLMEADTRLVKLTNNVSRISVYDYPRTNVMARSGKDDAVFLGREKSETFVAKPTSSSLSDGTVSIYAYGFDEVTAATSRAGDVAKLYGSAGMDEFQATSTSARLTGSGFKYTALNFGKVSAYGEGGADLALMTGTSGNETLTGTPSVTSMASTQFSIAAYRFARAFAVSGGGEDVATLRDSPGIDVLNVSPSQAEWYGSSYAVVAAGYRRVNAYGSSGNDVAQFTGSIGNDTFTGKPQTSVLSGSGYRISANGFGRVTAAGNGGTDVANLYDSAYDDIATVGYQSASLQGYLFENRVTDFDRTQLYASEGNDVARLSGSVGDDRFVGSQTSATLTSLGFTAALQRFDAIELTRSQGGVDQVLINSIAYQLLIGLGWSQT